MAVTITINGERLSAEPGTTVLEAARAHDIYFRPCATHRSCRLWRMSMCVVEIDRWVASPRPARFGRGGHGGEDRKPGASGAAARDAVSAALEHPYTCLTCPTKNGCVEFQGTIRKAAVTTGC